jgi:hypothetical protein
MLEAALTLTFFLTVMFSLFDFGYDLWQYQTIVSRAPRIRRYRGHPEHVPLQPDDYRL